MTPAGYAPWTPIVREAFAANRKRLRGTAAGDDDILPPWQGAAYVTRAVFLSRADYRRRRCRGIVDFCRPATSSEYKGRPCADLASACNWLPTDHRRHFR